MNGTPFKLGTFAKRAAGLLPPSCLATTMSSISRPHRRRSIERTDSIDGLLENWDANFAALQEICVAVSKRKVGRGAVKLATLRALPPVRRPGKMFYAAQNFQEHVDEMLRAGMTPASGPKFTGEKSTSDPYLFLKAPSTLCGANDDIAIPLGLKKIDWEAEIALAIGKPGKRIKAERALDHVAGFMTTNDVSARDLQIRADRPGPALGLAQRQEPRQFRADRAVPGAARLRAGPQELVHPPHASTAKSSRTATPRNSSSRPRSRSNTPRTFSRWRAATFSAAAPAAASARAPTPFSRSAT